jgi:hypothetical protein
LSYIALERITDKGISKMTKTLIIMITLYASSFQAYGARFGRCTQSGVDKAPTSEYRACVQRNFDLASSLLSGANLTKCIGKSSSVDFKECVKNNFKTIEGKIRDTGGFIMLSDNCPNPNNRSSVVEQQFKNCITAGFNKLGNTL